VLLLNKSIFCAMGHDSVTFANSLGEAVAPFLLWVRSTGFFEAPVYMSAMTAVSIPLFLWLKRRLRANGTLSTPRARVDLLWLTAYYGLCFLATNVLAVAFKTLIVEELDYESRVWFEAYVGPLHFYIVSAILAYIALLLRARREPLDVVLGAYVQMALIAGYAVGVYRMMNEPFSIVDLTTGVGGLILAAYFAIYNYDLYRRFLATGPRVGQG